MYQVDQDTIQHNMQYIVLIKKMQSICTDQDVTWHFEHMNSFDDNLVMIRSYYIWKLLYIFVFECDSLIVCLVQMGIYLTSILIFKFFSSAFILSTSGRIY